MKHDLARVFARSPNLNRPRIAKFGNIFGGQRREYIIAVVVEKNRVADERRKWPAEDAGSARDVGKRRTARRNLALQRNATGFGVGFRRQTPNHAAIFFDVLARFQVNRVDGRCANRRGNGVFRSVETTAIDFHRRLQNVTENLPCFAFVARTFDVTVGNVMNSDARDFNGFHLRFLCNGRRRPVFQGGRNGLRGKAETAKCGEHAMKSARKCGKTEGVRGGKRRDEATSEMHSDSLTRHFCRKMPR